MMVAIVGNKGSGKTLSVVREVMRSPHVCFTNFKVNSKNSIRMKKEHIVKEIVEADEKGKEKKHYEVNWKFWNDNLERFGEFNIFIDEIHNIVHARQAMSKWNVLCSIWVSQIRKLLGEKERTHFYLISQRMGRIEKSFRDLLDYVIYCRKICNPYKMIETELIGKDGIPFKVFMPETWIMQYHFSGEECVERYLQFRDGYKTYQGKTGFIANEFFKYYDTREVLGETAYL